LHCTENPEITVQYISDSGAVQLSRRCQDSLKEISCQGKMTQMAMYDELKCPEEMTTTSTVEVSTSEGIQNEGVLIIKPENMLEDVTSADSEVDFNLLDFNDAKKSLDLTLNDQPEEPSEQDKEKEAKMAEEKEILLKKKNIKKQTMKRDDTEKMMGDAPNQGKEESSTKFDMSTDRERRDVSETTAPTVEKDFTTDESTNFSVTEESSPMTTESTTEVPFTTVTEETTTKNIVQGHPLFHNHAVFKEPISIDNINSTMERKDISNNEDHFIPPMLLVKARFTPAKAIEENVEEIKEIASDTNSTSMPNESLLDASNEENNATKNITLSSDAAKDEISSTTIEDETTSATLATTENPILVQKRNNGDGRHGLIPVLMKTQSLIVTTSEAPQTTSESLPTSTEEDLTTPNGESTSFTSPDSTISDHSTTTDSQTDLLESSTAEVSVSSLISEEKSGNLEDKTTAETLHSSSTVPILVEKKMSRISSSSETKVKNQSSNDIDKSESQEHSEDSTERHLHESNLNNEENLQPHKPNRHRSILHNEHHHGPGFSIGKILG
jgi:hypothetical protein